MKSKRKNYNGRKL